MLDARTAENIKEFIVQTVSNIIRTRTANIKSGWKITFNILNAAASTVPNGMLNSVTFPRCRMALDVIELILQDHIWIAVEYFSELSRCLVSFGSLNFEKVTTRQNENESEDLQSAEIAQLPLKVR